MRRKNARNAKRNIRYDSLLGCSQVTIYLVITAVLLHFLEHSIADVRVGRQAAHTACLRQCSRSPVVGATSKIAVYHKNHPRSPIVDGQSENPLLGGVTSSVPDMENVRQSPDVSDKLAQLFIATPKGQVSSLYLSVHT